MSDKLKVGLLVGLIVVICAAAYLINGCVPVTYPLIGDNAGDVHIPGDLHVGGDIVSDGDISADGDVVADADNDNGGAFVQSPAGNENINDNANDNTSDNENANDNGNENDNGDGHPLPGNPRAFLTLEETEYKQGDVVKGDFELEAEGKWRVSCPFLGQVFGDTIETEEGVGTFHLEFTLNGPGGTNLSLGWVSVVCRAFRVEEDDSVDFACPTNDCPSAIWEFEIVD